MRLCRYLGIAGLIWSLVVTGVAQAAAVPAYSGGMNNAIGSILKYKTSKWGFAANDPRIVASTTAIGAGLTEVAVAVGTGAVATVGWPAMLASAGIAAVAGGVVALVPSLIDWLWGDGANQGKAQVSGTGMGTSDGSNLPTMPGTYSSILDTYGVGQDLYFRQTDGKFRHVKTISVKCATSSYCNKPAPYNGNLDYTFTTAYTGPYPGVNGYWSQAYVRAIGSVSGSQYEYDMVYDFVPPSGVPIAPPSYTPTLKPVGDVVADLPSNVLAQPISDKMLADAVNAAWRAAPANPNAVPWSASDPVTPADIAAWRAANPDGIDMPTVNDFISPVAPTSASSVTVPLATQAGTETPPVTPGEGQQIDLGPDPNIGAPALEPTPTAQQILGPLLNLMPDLKSFVVPAHTAACPQPSFTALGSSYTISSHCSLIESNRSILEAAMLLVWTIAATMIVLRA